MVKPAMLGLHDYTQTRSQDFMPGMAKPEASIPKYFSPVAAYLLLSQSTAMMQQGSL